MNPDLKAQIRNRLQGLKTTLDLLYRGKRVSKEFIELARKDLDEAVRLLNKEDI